MNGSFHSVAEKRLSGVEGFIDLGSANYSVKLSVLLANYFRPSFSVRFLLLSFLFFPPLCLVTDRFWSINFNPCPERRSHSTLVVVSAYFCGWVQRALSSTDKAKRERFARCSYKIASSCESSFNNRRMKNEEFLMDFDII